MSRDVRNNVFERMRAAGLPAFVVAAALWCVVYSPVLRGMFGGFMRSFDETQNLLYPVVALLLLWMARERFRGMSRERSAAGPMLAAVALALYAWGWMAGKYVTMQYSFCMGLLGLALWFFGARAARMAWCPLVLVFMMVPWHPAFRQAVIEPARALDRMLTVRAAAGALKLMGVPAWGEGFYVNIPSGRLNIDVTCTGMSYIMSLIVVTLCIIYLVRGGGNRKWFLLLFVPLTGTLANILRVTLNVFVAHAWGVAAGFRFFHDAGGMIFALAALLGMLGAARMLKVPLAGEPPPRVADTGD